MGVFTIFCLCPSLSNIFEFPLSCVHCHFQFYLYYLSFQFENFNLSFCVMNVTFPLNILTLNLLFLSVKT